MNRILCRTGLIALSVLGVIGSLSACGSDEAGGGSGNPSGGGTAGSGGVGAGGISGGGTGGIEPDSGPDSAVDTGVDAGLSTPECAALAEAECAALEKCSTFALKLLFLDETACLADRTEHCALRQLAPGTGFTPAAIAACAATWEAADCGSIFADEVDCDVKGTLPTGSGCAFSSQCESGSCWAQGCGTCYAALPTGSSCQINPDCALGNLCENGTCQKKFAGLGEPCDAAVTCHNGLLCTGGVCALGTGTAGAPCTKDVDCDWPHGFYCNFDDTCVQATSVVPPNSPCGAATPEKVFCGGSSICYLNQCRPQPGLGESCGSGPCAGNLACIQFECAELDPTDCQ